MVPMRIVPIGETEIPEEIVDSFIEENRSRFSEETYDLLRHNCNNFSDELVFFLTSMHIPQEILDLPQVRKQMNGRMKVESTPHLLEIDFHTSRPAGYASSRVHGSDQGHSSFYIQPR